MCQWDVHYSIELNNLNRRVFFCNYQDISNELITILKLRHIVMMHTCDNDVLFDHMDHGNYCGHL